MTKRKTISTQSVVFNEAIQYNYYAWLGFGAKGRGEHNNILMMDIRPNIGDETGDVRAIPFNDNTFEGVELHHVIEHLSEEDGNLALSEIRRVLKTGGEFHISAPDMEACARTLLVGNTTILLNIYSPHVDQAQWHRWGYTKATIYDKLKNAGFVNIRAGGATEPHEFRFICYK